MRTPITETTVTFTYPIADELYSTSNSLNRTATASYTGPDRIFVFVNAETGDYNPADRVLTTEDEGGDIPVPFGSRRVVVTAAADPAIIALFLPQKVTVQDQTRIVETLPNGEEYSYNGTATIDQTYNLDFLMHDGEQWVLPAFKEPFVTWDEIKANRTNMLLASDGKIAPDQPDSVKQPWIDYRRTLRDLPATFGYGTANEVAAWKISMPKPPGDN